MKIVITDKDTVTKGDLDLGIFSEFGDVVEYGLTAADEVSERIADADIVLCNKTLLNRDTLKEAKSLKYIGLFATGYNNIDLEYTKKKNITVCNAPGYSTGSVVQHTFALILELYNRVYEYNRKIKAGDWIKSRTFSYFPIPLNELEGKTAGIIGYGAIGKKVAEAAHAFGVKVLAYTRTPKESDITEFTDFYTLLEKSDIVTLHCPLNEQTTNLMNQDAFGRMKKNAVLINTSRGAVVDENALYNALCAEKIAGAGLDVLCNEPMSPDCILKDAPNCIITPHIAWAGLETRIRLLDIVIANIKGFLSGNIQNNVGL